MQRVSYCVSECARVRSHDLRAPRPCLDAGLRRPSGTLRATAQGSSRATLPRQTGLGPSHNPKVAGSNPAPAIEADQSRRLAKSRTQADRDPEGRSRGRPSSIGDHGAVQRIYSEAPSVTGVGPSPSRCLTGLVRHEPLLRRRVASRRPACSSRWAWSSARTALRSRTRAVCSNVADRR